MRFTSMPRRVAILVMVVATAVALAAGELVAGAVRSWRSPVEAVAETVIDRAPPSFTKFGISTFGKNDKAALVVGIVALLLVLAIGAALLARRLRWIVPVTFGVVGIVGLLASADGRFAATDGVPSLVAAVAGIATCAFLLTRRPSPADTVIDDTPAAASVFARRQFLIATGAMVALAAAGVAGGRALAGRFSAAASRLALRLPSAPKPLPAAPAATALDVPGITPLFTPNADFYRIDTALTVPQVPVEGWTLKVTGMVDEPYEVDFDELAAMGLIETDITLTCVSNPVGGDLVGNARWLGVPLRTVLDRAGVQSRADQIVGRSVDDYSCGFPVESAYDRDAIVAIGMNGEPLPLRHGFPARLVTPGLYGYTSATKWLREIELTTFADFDQYWVPRGYAVRAPIKTSSRIDVPRSGEILEPGEHVIAGVAWAQPVGVEAVEVKVDDEPFVAAEMADALSDDTWRQWRLPWTATAGAHRIVVRAVDRAGRRQIEERAEILPDGASGWQSRLVTVRGPV